MNKKKYILLPFILILLSVGVAADYLFYAYHSIVVGALDDSAGFSSEDYKTKALENGKDVAIRVEEEGSVLLKNNGVLPLTDALNGKINVYGTVSAGLFVGTSGSASSNASAVSLKTALADAGIVANPALWSFLESHAPQGSTSNVGNNLIRGYEVTLADYESAVSWQTSFSYSPYALVTLGALGGEGGSDFERAADGSSNALELDANEIALLSKLDEEGFTVITLINSSTVMELGEVQAHSDAILWVGGTGVNGARGIVNLLIGKENPSGRTVDTWMAQEETSSSYFPALLTNDSLYVASGGQTLSGYSHYNEGIYLGYRWYETADAEGYWSSYPHGYDDVVLYPFGYGLSYTSFSERILQVKPTESGLDFEIQIENTGEIAGKDAVELYVEKPYSPSGVEASKVELVNFSKSNNLEAGATEKLLLSVSKEDLASFDSTADNGQGAYVLSAGDYQFYLASGLTGAHCWKGIDKAAGDRYFKTTYSAFVYDGDNKRSSDRVASRNLVETTSNDSGVSSAETTCGYCPLSRKNGFANAPEAIGSAVRNGKVVLQTSNPLYQALTKYIGSSTYANANADHLAILNEFGDDVRLGTEATYSLTDLSNTGQDGKPLYTVGKDGTKTYQGSVSYTDSRWPGLISQMSSKEMAELIGHGAYGTIAVSSIGKTASLDYDGPLGLTNFLKATIGEGQSTNSYPSEPVMASTWNASLMEELGRAIGQEANAFNQSGWYAPGLNLHRTPFEGRTAEYFSEDAFLSGKMGAQEVKGAAEKGLLCYGKHFALNETETNRYKSINASISEQAAGELYFRPFEIGIKQGGMLGLMVSFSSVNGQWVGGNYGIMRELVRQEWGFHGVVVTDTAYPYMMSCYKAVCAGTDLMLSSVFPLTNPSYAFIRLDMMKNSDGTFTDEGVLAMKTACKHILYSIASSALYRDITTAEPDSRKSTAIFIMVNVVAYGGTLGLATAFIVQCFPKKKKQIREETPVKKA